MNISPLAQRLIDALEKKRFDFSNEKLVQQQMSELFDFTGVTREYRLSNSHIVDFFINGIAIEVKLKGGKRNIYRQCEWYCSYDEVKMLILVTAMNMGFPETIATKPCYVVRLSKAWL